MQKILAYFLPKSMQLRCHRLELDVTEFLAFFIKKYAIEVSHTRAEFYRIFGPIFSPKSMQLRFLILELCFTEYLGLFFYQKVCS